MREAAGSAPTGKASIGLQCRRNLERHAALTAANIVSFPGRTCILATMPKRKTPLPFLLAELTFASWETINRRALMMMRGACSPAEYSRMISEKIAAATHTASALARAKEPPKLGTLLTPWHKRATANARRLRRK